MPEDGLHVVGRVDARILCVGADQVAEHMGLQVLALGVVLVHEEVDYFVQVDVLFRDAFHDLDFTDPPSETLERLLFVEDKHLLRHLSNH